MGNYNTNKQNIARTNVRYKHETLANFDKIYHYVTLLTHQEGKTLSSERVIIFKAPSPSFDQDAIAAGTEAPFSSV